MPNLTDRRITESSGLAFSRLTADLLYTQNDETTKPHIFAVQPSTGNTVGTCSVKGATLGDPEAIAVDANGVLWLGDLGDNDSNRSHVSVYRRSEPGVGDQGDLDFTRYDLAYPGGARNAETLLIHPVTNERYIISKASPGGLYKLPESLVVGSTNTLTDLAIAMPNLVSDGTFTIDGRFVLLRRKDQNTSVFVLDPASSWAVIDTIGVPSQIKPEGITMAADGLSFWISSEGKNAPLYNVALPTLYQPIPATPPPPNPCVGATPPPPVPADTPVTGLTLTNWKLTLPTGSKGSPLEIKQPTLATFRDDRFFFFDPAYGTVFRCPGDGVTTKNSSNPRTELREMTNNGASNAAWSSASGTHTLRVVGKITAAPHDVVVAQIHDASDDVTVVRYIVADGELWATDGDNIHGHLLGAYTLGTEYEVKLEAAGGQIKTYYNTVLKQTLSVSRSGLYMKFGAYHQSHGSGSAFAEVKIAVVEVTHA